ncbi:MAG: DUF58 domain-containing protein [Verrucomicrobiae bacterium]|nr:DUF58 domain-containing protein [Verrucomicrobiae bacterium]
MPDPLFDTAFLRKLEQLHLLSRKIFKGRLKGERRSKKRGQSVEFADYRNYVAGDDLRYLDWNLFGRLERLFLKMYEEEEELRVTIFLDTSESMSFGNPAKIEYAKKIAAALGYIALCNFDTVQVLPLSDGTADSGTQALGHSATPPRPVHGKRMALRFFQDIVQLPCEGKTTLNESLRRQALKARRAGVSILISDFLSPDGYEDGLKHLLARHNDIYTFHILAPEELKPSFLGDWRVVDSETGATTEVSISRGQLKKYQQTVNAFCQRLKEYCTQRGVNYLFTSTDQPFEDLMLKYIRKAGMAR